MSDAYRDDLEAAQARVSDLEREAARLRERNAELTAQSAAPQAQAIATPTPEPSPFAKAMVTVTKACGIAAIMAVGGSRFQHDPPPTPHFEVAAIFLGLGLLCWWLSGFQSLRQKR